MYRPSILDFFFFFFGKRLKQSKQEQPQKEQRETLRVAFNPGYPAIKSFLVNGARESLKCSRLSASLTPVVFNIQQVPARTMEQSTFTLMGRDRATAVAVCFDQHLQLSFFNFTQVNGSGEDAMRYRSPIWSSQNSKANTYT